MSESPSNPFGEAFSALGNLGAFGKLMPGLDFLQQWAKTAGAGLPGVGQWVAPTLDPQELDKRIQDLRTVQFWLEQNARMLGMTIQALEVQRMTLNTLQGMNVSMDALRESMTMRTEPPATPAAPPASDPPPPPSYPWTLRPPAPEPAPASAQPFADPHPAPDRPAETTGSDDLPAPGGASGAEAAAGTEAGTGMPDPMRWWGALTQQFASLAAHTMQDALRAGAPDAAASEGESVDTPDANQAAPGSARRKRGAAAAPTARSGSGSGKAGKQAADPADERVAGKDAKRPAGPAAGRSARTSGKASRTQGSADESASPRPLARGPRSSR